MSSTIIHGDCAKVLPSFVDGSFHACITDPPYEIDYLGLAWDKPGTVDSHVWTEVRRVLVPGAHLIALAAPRTAHRLATAIEAAGFEIRDMIFWVFANAGSTSADVGSKAGGERYRGFRPRLKGMHNPIIVARKPMEGRSLLENMVQFGTGALAIDACRVPYANDNVPRAGHRTSSFQNSSKSGATSAGGDGSGGWLPNAMGRHPGNVIGHIPEMAPYVHVPRANRADRLLPDTGERNPHPTIKPVALMEHLIRLVAPANGHVLDPFNGSGTTGVACKRLGVSYTGIELDPRYVEISRRRIAAEPDLFDEPH